MPQPQPEPVNDGDFYQHDGEAYENGNYYPGISTERKEMEAEETAPIVSSYPIMGSVAQWFQDQIDNCPDITNIQISTTTINGVKYSRQVSIEGQVLAYQLLKQLLTEKAGEFEEFIPSES